MITDDYRTKMVDWMIEVCTSFSCSERTWFLSVALFDKYLFMMKGKKILKNSDVHAIGIAAMYIASKYEDVYPFNSFIAHERISHKAVPQKDILRMESEFLRLFEFDLELVTPFDFNQYTYGILSYKFTLPEHSAFIKRSEELSLYLLRMAIENHADYMPYYSHSVMNCAAMLASVALLRPSCPQSMQSFLSEFESQVMQLSRHIGVSNELLECAMKI